VHPADPGGLMLRQIVERNGIRAADDDDVGFGTTDVVGPLVADLARTCWLASGLPLVVPGVTGDRQCGSSQQAGHFAAQAVMSVPRMW
jgi:acetyl-CoA acetyltransferase